MLQNWYGIGRLTRDPELTYTASGIAVTKVCLAIERPFANAEGKREADFVDVVTWRHDAEFAANYLEKGRLVHVAGWWKSRTYTDRETNKRHRCWEVQCTQVKALDRPNNGGPSESSGGYRDGDEEQGPAPDPMDT